ncbi:dTDP-4-dehydrorhamnose 3,5-epimerase [Stappia sp. BW2]|uniref:dTDP-4-dehydrorhamnose 3,5-epimerase n=1 Tax=Stappia sp. BW2 TaxID=2592622 RepID=UPI0011DEF602|nr:dTDP-4-dehydrorhamnose 3,5-epimerase [Stappia sp. BW2]TYC66933.1 dTDP-4-dehydrorhamnose 3,5-epimerase [Stappia sp. BW2]
MLEVIELDIPEVKIICPKRHGDSRGFFSETYNKALLSDAGIDIDFVQDNHAYSAEKGTVRGLHFQMPPFAQDKLVRVVRGAILDVALDLRLGSPTYGQHVSSVISAENGKQILVPSGFAHGLATLEPHTEVLYKVSQYYAPEHDRGILWNDPDLAIDWGLAEADAILSAKDRGLPRFGEIGACFSCPEAAEG